MSMFNKLFLIAVLLFPASLLAAEATLTWTDNSNNEDGFTIERQLNGGPFTFLFSTGANIVTVTDATLQQSNTTDNNYCWRALAFNSAGKSAFSNTACATIPKLVTVPAAPSNLTVQ
jgi:hypothetical protein